MAEREQDAVKSPRQGQGRPQMIADRVFETLHLRILRLELPPLTKISEADVAAQMGVSRQPVREAFKRLAKLGFLVIRPQSGTVVSLISEEAVSRAFYIRRALEEQTCRTACSALSTAGLEVLSGLLAQQKDAVIAEDREMFHTLDEAFHREICRQSGVGYVWDVIHESKAHMDRVRLITLNAPSQKIAYEQHVAIYEALLARAPEQAAEAMGGHLSRILTHIEAIKSENHHWFVEHDA